MQATFWMAVAAREAVIDGDLAAAQQAARHLSEHDYGALPEHWRHWVDQMRQRADDVAVAPDLTTAARSVAQLGLTCGNCHAQQRGSRRGHEQAALQWQDPPDQIDERMLRHEIGVDEMWVGLVQASEQDWRNGTLSLTRAPLSPPMQAGSPVDPAMAQRIEEIRHLARNARTARSHAERAEIYGELLARCAGCHYAIRPAAR